jgi:hypothetical protein
MDVDVMETSEGSKEKRVCYHCKLPGHLRKDCRKRLAEEAKARKQQTQVCQTEVIDEEKEDTLAAMRKNVKAMKESKKRDFLASLVNEHF